MKRTLNERILAENIKIPIDDRVSGHNSNVLTIGGSGSGKSTGFVAPNLANPSNSSYVIQDTKGKLYDSFAESLRDKGFEVSKIDFVNPESSSYGYNPLSLVRRREDGTLIEKDIKKLATSLMPPLDRRDPFWEKTATRILAMYIAYVLEALPEEEQNMSSVIDIHHLYQSDTGRKLFDRWVNENPASYSARKYKMMSNTYMAEKMHLSFMEFCNEALDAFDCAEFQKIFCNENQLDFASFGRKKQVIFVVTSDHDKSYGILSNILYCQFLQELLDEADKQPDGRLKLHVSFYLDDFCSGGAITDFAETLSIIRSRNISCNIILQSLSQLTGMYGQSNATSIINNCSTILYLGSNDMESAELIAQHINQTPHSILSLPADKEILIMEGNKPMIVNKITPQNPMSGLQCTL